MCEQAHYWLMKAIGLNLIEIFIRGRCLNPNLMRVRKSKSNENIKKAFSRVSVIRFTAVFRFAHSPIAWNTSDARCQRKTLIMNLVLSSWGTIKIHAKKREVSGSLNAWKRPLGCETSKFACSDLALKIAKGWEHWLRKVLSVLSSSQSAHTHKANSFIGRRRKRKIVCCSNVWSCVLQEHSHHQNHLQKQSKTFWFDFNYRFRAQRKNI